MILYRDGEQAALLDIDIDRALRDLIAAEREAAAGNPSTGTTGSDFSSGGNYVDIHKYIRRAGARQAAIRGQPKPAELWEHMRPLLPEGEANAIPMRALAARMGVSERRLRAQVNLLRKWGAPILSSRDGQRGGYFTASTPEEAAHAVNSLRSQAYDLLRTAAALQRRLQVDGQTVFADEGGSDEPGK